MFYILFPRYKEILKGAIYEILKNFNSLFSLYFDVYL